MPAHDAFQAVPNAPKWSLEGLFAPNVCTPSFLAHQTDASAVRTPCDAPHGEKHLDDPDSGGYKAGSVEVLTL